MANQEHVDILKQGAEAWNQWQYENKDIIANLNNADLGDADLSYAHLRGANLRNANLAGADLIHAHLNNATLSDVDLSRAYLSYADLSYADLSDAHLSNAHLSDSNLSGANLRHAHFSDANLSGANLSGANLRRADLSRADLSYADLSRADLVQADLIGSDLRHADLSRADLSRADLSYADLSRANLNRTDLSRAQLEYTVFGDLDLSQAVGLDTVRHISRSIIDIETIYLSQGKIPEKFLRHAGVQENFIEYMHSLVGVAIQFYSCFISYSSKDGDFAERLYNDLQGAGVRCWLALHDLPIGEPILRGLDQAIRVHEKTLLVLSENSVQSRWVGQEVEMASARELQSDSPTTILFPIRLDNAVMETDVMWADTIRRTRNIGDFTRWKERNVYQKSFDRLLRDLKAGDTAK